jgi:hypothetical protein
LSDIISWDKAIDKKVKSSDNEDLGKVESITKDYIQTKEGLVSKNYYYIPKYYMQGFDGDNILISLSKAEVKSRFEREKAPNLSEIETPSDSERRTSITNQYPDFDRNMPRNISTTYTGSAPDEQSVAMPWERIINKKVKSSDNEDLGKVESVASNYVEVKEGIVSKKHYYIPKYYIQGFDGENLHTSISKSDVKDRYERESPPLETEFQSPEYEQHKKKVDSTNPQFLHGIPWMAKEPGVQMPLSDSETLGIPWQEVIHKRVKTSDNIDIGDIERVGNEFIVVREGVANVHLYYIPKVYINNYDGSSIYVAVPSGLVSPKFERNSEPTPEELKLMGKEAQERMK